MSLLFIFQSLHLYIFTCSSHLHRESVCEDALNILVIFTYSFPYKMNDEPWFIFTHRFPCKMNRILDNPHI